jgi:hypothetical protein
MKTVDVVNIKEIYDNNREINKNLQLFALCCEKYVHLNLNVISIIAETLIIVIVDRIIFYKSLYTLTIEDRETMTQRKYSEGL